MLFQIKKLFRFANYLKLFMFYFLLQTSLGNLHKHSEFNLHFHAENIITKDHTVAIEKDCNVCPALYSASHFNFQSNYLYHFLSFDFLEVNIPPITIKAKKSFGSKLGRAPPFIG